MYTKGFSIDAFSKMLYAERIRSKQGKEIARLLERIFERAGSPPNMVGFSLHSFQPIGVVAVAAKPLSLGGGGRPQNLSFLEGPGLKWQNFD